MKKLFLSTALLLMGCSNNTNDLIVTKSNLKIPLWLTQLKRKMDRIESFWNKRYGWIGEETITKDENLNLVIDSSKKLKDITHNLGVTINDINNYNSHNKEWIKCQHYINYLINDKEKSSLLINKDLIPQIKKSWANFLIKRINFKKMFQKYEKTSSKPNEIYIASDLNFATLKQNVQLELIGRLYAFDQKRIEDLGRTYLDDQDNPKSFIKC